VPSRERCPKCGSTNITGRAFDMADGDEAQERYCYDCKHFEDRLRSQGGVSWYADVVLAPPHRMHSAEGIEATLLAQIRAAPDDDAPRSIYADWLIERGDPLGTFIALQLARAQKRDPVVSEEEQKLLDAHWSAWVGEASAIFESYQVAFERGFWSMARAETRAQYEVIARYGSLVPIEELGMLFDVSRDPPSLAEPGLVGLRRLMVGCLPEFAVRWIERAHAVNITDLSLVASDEADIGEALDRARRTCITRLGFWVSKNIELRAVRDTDGSFLIRSVCLPDRARTPWLPEVKRWVVQLGDLVDPAVKVEMSELEPGDAEEADLLGLKLVRRTPRSAASPTIVTQVRVRP
jgi:uncharacterized protein (TIGR02996 family)